MKHDTLYQLFPPDLPDEVVWALLEFLYELTRAFENYYAAQLRRHWNNHPIDSDEPPDDLWEGDDPPF